MKIISFEKYRIFFWSIIIPISFLVIIILAFIFLQNNAYAVTIQDIENKKEQSVQLDNQINLITKTIKQVTRNAINSEVAVRNIQFDLYELEKSVYESWDYQTQLESMEKKLDTQQTNLKNIRDRLNQLKAEREQLKQSLTILKSEIKDIENSYTGKNKLIGIRLSSTCISLLKSNTNTTCPTYQDLLPFDSSDIRISGNFTFDEKGFFYRQEPSLKKSWELYRQDPKPRNIVDPPKGMTDIIPQIIIESNFDTYLLQGQLTINPEYKIVTEQVKSKVTGKTRTLQYQNKTQEFATIQFHDRYIDDKCLVARINSEVWQKLLPDTLLHLRMGCTDDSTQFNERVIIYQNKTKINRMDHKWYQYQEWLSQVLSTCILKYQACKE